MTDPYEVTAEALHDLPNEVSMEIVLGFQYHLDGNSEQAAQCFRTAVMHYDDGDGE